MHETLSSNSQLNTQCSSYADEQCHYSRFPLASPKSARVWKGDCIKSLTLNPLPSTKLGLYKALQPLLKLASPTKLDGLVCCFNTLYQHKMDRCRYWTNIACKWAYWTTTSSSWTYDKVFYCTVNYYGWLSYCGLLEKLLWLQSVLWHCWLYSIEDKHCHFVSKLYTRVTHTFCTLPVKKSFSQKQPIYCCGLKSAHTRLLLYFIIFL